ncbi:hypothetical protein NC652_015131 [Populus alba x Populus x berolinensis]|nr:hypothetical protein NC652_015131 [Populus alba x Populus x berolinensis]
MSNLYDNRCICFWLESDDNNFLNLLDGSHGFCSSKFWLAQNYISFSSIGDIQ